jgi:tetratricopeptide (TPR) repeat protein
MRPVQQGHAQELHHVSRPAESTAQASLARRLSSGAPDQIAGQDAVAEADAVIARIDWAHLTGGSPDWTAMTIVAALHHQRAGLLDAHRRREELLLAADLLTVANRLVPGGREGPDATGDLRPFNSVGLRILHEAERTGEVAVSARAAFLFRHAAEQASSGDRHRATYLSNLGAALMHRFERTGAESALAAAIEAFRSAAQDHGPERAACLANLGAALASHHERTGDLDQLDEAIDAQRQAADLAAGSDSHALYLSNLGTMLTTMFERLGDEEFIAEAVSVLSAAVRATAPDGPELATRLVNLGRAQLGYFEHTGDSELLQAGVTALREAVEATQENDPELPARLSNLAAGMILFYRRFRDGKALELAVEALLEAVRLPHRHRVSHLSNLGGAYQYRFGVTGDIADLDAAITRHTEALGIAPEGHPIVASLLSNLGNAHLRRFRAAGRHDDLTAARTTLADAAARTPADDPDRCAYLTNQADAAAEDPADQEEALRLYRAAVDVVTAPAIERARAARALGRLAMGEQGGVATALAAFTELIALLAEAVWHGLGRIDQAQLLHEFSGTASDAAACAIALHDGRRAVELLEQGRAVLFGRALDSRVSDTLLSERHPRLATQLREVLAELTRHGGRDPVEVHEVEPATERAQRFRRLASRRKALLDKIRALPDLSDFLLPAGFATVSAAAAAGPVVMVNISDLRCDALIVTIDGVDVLPLDTVTAGDVTGFAQAFVEVVDATRVLGDLSPSRRREMAGTLRDILDWLWRDIACPVVRHLRLPERTEGWPRLWWCPTGLLGLLPLHAAQTYDHERFADIGLADHVISSYTPTLRALTAARRAPRGQSRRLVAVGVPNTPGQPALRHVERELAVVTRLAPATTLLDHEATANAVAESLRVNEYLHFIGHSGQNLRQPDRAKLFLMDGELTMLDISGLGLTDAELAYLSSCEGAAPIMTLPDEAIHLAAALQLAGYRGVIASLWTVRDEVAPDIASRVYTHLTRAGGIDTSGAAEALHLALLAFRATHPPLVWAGYCHTGV